MKCFSLFLLSSLLAFSGWCQSSGAPGFFTYQGIARSGDGSPLTNATIGLKISILSNGTAAFAEEFPEVPTSNVGNFVIRVGTGEHDSNTASFDSIPWEEGPFQMKVELRPPSSETYFEIGATDLRSVPYALYAENAGNAGGLVTSVTFDSDSILTILQGDSINEVDLSAIFADLTLDLDEDELSFQQNGTNLGDPVDLSVYKEQLEIADGILTLNGANPGVDLHDIIATQTELTYNAESAILSLANGNSVELFALQQKLKLNGETLFIVPYDDPNGLNSVQLNLGSGGTSPWAVVAGGITYGDQVGIGISTFDNPTAKLSVKGIQTILNAANIEVIENNPNYTHSEPVLNLGAASIIRANNGDIRVLASARAIGDDNEPQEAGSLTLYGENQTPNIMLSSNSENPNNGRIFLYDDEGERRLSLIVDTGGSGRLVLFGADGSKNLELSSLLGSSNPNHGSLTLFGPGGTGNKRLEMYVDNNGVGRINTYGTNGELNCSIGSSPDNPNFGELLLYNDSGNEAQAGFKYENNGYTAFADIKNFKMNYPGDPNKEIWYSAVEGPEAGAYLRGSEILINGEASILFPDHFVKTINHETMTVYVSPSSGQSLGLAVIEKMEDGFKVKELHQGQGNYSFDWDVKAVRKGFEDFEVVRTK
jgi:hypothetical protein